MHLLLRGLSLSVLLLASASSQPGTHERHFTFHYAFTVRNTHLGEPLRVSGFRSRVQTSFRL